MTQKKVFNFSLATMTILNGYAFSFMRGFSLAMLLTTFFAGLELMAWIRNPARSIKIRPVFLVFWVYAVIQTFFVALTVNETNGSNIIYIILKIFIWALFLTFARYFFDYKLLVKYMKWVIAVTFVYLVLQYILHYVVNVSLPCSFDLGIIKSNYESYEYSIKSTQSVFRPGSFWLEPAYLGYFYNSFLSLCLFDKSTDELFLHKNRYILIACIGILMSGSTGGIGIMLILLLLWLLNKNKRQGIIGIMILVALAFFAFLFVQNNWIESFKGISPSLDNTIWKLQNLDEVGRVGKSFELIERLPMIYKPFGLGLGNESYFTGGEYMNGIVTVVMWLGYVGLGVWLALFAWAYLRYCKTTVQRVMLFVILFNGVFSGMYFGAHSFIYFLVAMYGGGSVIERPAVLERIS